MLFYTWLFDYVAKMVCNFRTSIERAIPFEWRNFCIVIFRKYVHNLLLIHTSYGHH